jgi:hypothetical protein
MPDRTVGPHILTVQRVEVQVFNFYFVQMQIALDAGRAS